jgi:tetratricopeptide (TPR) repeat protein
MVAIHDYRNDSDGSVDDTAPNNSNSNSNSNSSNASTSSWRGWKERGKIAYLRGDYASALQNYLQAVQRQHNSFGANTNANSNNNSNSSVRDFSFPSRLDQQILLSNTIACRLKLGGAPQAEAAVVTAKKCIAINRKWAKGHFRLAEAYLSLARSYEDKTESTQDQFSKSTNTNADPKSASQKRLECSNKACDALQMVIQLDPGNQSARNLLTKELQYLAVGSENSSSSNGGVNGAPEPSAPPEHMDENNNSNTSNNNTSDNSNQEPSTRINTNNNDNNNIDINININNDSSNTGNDIDIEEDDHYDYTLSWQDRLSFTAYRIRAWYLGLCEDDKMVVKLAVLFVVSSSVAMFFSDDPWSGVFVPPKPKKVFNTRQTNQNKPKKPRLNHRLHNNIILLHRNEPTFLCSNLDSPYQPRKYNH